MSSSNRKKLTSKEKQVDKKNGGKTNDGSLKEVALGDIIWVKSRLSWWPAQVVDEKAVSKSKKPRKRLSSEVLVRIYGSYTYKYVEPVICRSEFKKILDQNNGSYNSILEKNLEKNLDRNQSGSRKRKVSNSNDKKTQTKETPKKLKPNNFSPSNGNSLAEKSKRNSLDEKSKGNSLAEKSKGNSLAEKSKGNSLAEKSKGNSLDEKSKGNSLAEKSQDLSARRIKIMKTLGLIAPTGSPFNKVLDNL